MAKVSWLARMGQNFDQAKRDNSFWPRPNILHVKDQFLNQILALFSNVLKPDRKARLLGYQVSPVWNVHKWYQKILGHFWPPSPR